jgi:hypothetical protein
MSDPGATLGWILAAIGLCALVSPVVAAIGFALFKLTRPAR